MTQVVINCDFGGFGLSDKAVERFFQLKGWTLISETTKYGNKLFYKESVSDDTIFDEYDLDREDKDLIKVVKELGSKANGEYSSLKILTIPDDVNYEIVEYDGREHIAEVHRTWFQPMQENFKLIIISDLLDSKKRKEQELKFYQDQLNELQTKMIWLKKEIQLTNEIIKMIEKEKVIDIKEMISKKDPS